MALSLNTEAWIKQYKSLSGICAEQSGTEGDLSASTTILSHHKPTNVSYAHHPKCKQQTGPENMLS